MWSMGISSGGRGKAPNPSWARSPKRAAAALQAWYSSSWPTSSALAFSSSSSYLGRRLTVLMYTSREAISKNSLATSRSCSCRARIYAMYCSRRLVISISQMFTWCLVIRARIRSRGPSYSSLTRKESCGSSMGPPLSFSSSYGAQMVPRKKVSLSSPQRMAPVIPPRGRSKRPVKRASSSTAMMTRSYRISA